LYEVNPPRAMAIIVLPVNSRSFNSQSCFPTLSWCDWIVISWISMSQRLLEAALAKIDLLWNYSWDSILSLKLLINANSNRFLSFDSYCHRKISRMMTIVLNRITKTPSDTDLEAIPRKISLNRNSTAITKTPFITLNTLLYNNSFWLCWLNKLLMKLANIA
jgi:hypothetical protein